MNDLKKSGTSKVPLTIIMMKNVKCIQKVTTWKSK